MGRDMRMRLSALAIGIAMVLALAACGGGSDTGTGGGDTAGGGGGGSTEGSEASAVSVTSIADLTGPTSATQVPYNAGIEVFLKSYDESLESGQHPIEFSKSDDMFETAKSVVAYRTAESEGDVATIGPQSGGIHPILAKGNMEVPLISGISTEISEAEAAPMIWNLMPSWVDQAEAIIAHGEEEGGPLRVATLYLNVPSGQEFAEVLKKFTEEAGGEYVGDVPIEVTEETGDWRAQAMKLAELKPTLVGALASAGDPQTFLPAMANAGLTDVAVGGVTPLGPYQENWTKTPPQLASKFFVVSSIMPADLAPKAAGELTAAAKSIGKPEYANNIYFVQGWVAAKLLAQAVNDAGNDPTAKSVDEALGKIHDFETDGLNPPLCFSPTNHVGTTSLRPIAVDLKTGKFVALGKYTKNRSCES